MKVLITGSSGTLGRMLIDYLISGGINVAGIDIKENPDHFPPEKYRFHLCSVTDRERLISIFAEEKPTNVIHLACSFNRVRNRKRENEIDICGAENILEASEKTESVRQLIFSGSAMAYGAHRDNRLWITEADTLRPGKSRYAINKKKVEEHYGSTGVRDDLLIVLLRICTVIGPSFDKPKSVASLLIRFPWLPAFCRQNKLQFIHRDDLVSLVGLILKDREIEGVFNLAPDSYAIVEDIVPTKKFIPVPISLIRFVLWLLWNTRTLYFQPAAVKNTIYPVVVDPDKIISRYNYKFKYSSAGAFTDTLINNRIPEGARI